jgi:hypothetical protein
MTRNRLSKLPKKEQFRAVQLIKSAARLPAYGISFNCKHAARYAGLSAPMRYALVGAVLAEQHDEWDEGRRYLGLNVLARSHPTTIPGTVPTTEEATTTDNIPALSA